MKASLPLARSAYRALSTFSSSSNSQLNSWIAHITSAPPDRAHDIIDTERASQLQRALPTRQTRSSSELVHDLKDGEELPKAHHLVYCRPKTLLKDLAADGSSTEHNPPPPYTRRMWASGSFAWSRSHSMKIGQPATQITTVPRVEMKKDMVFVNQQRVLYPRILEREEADREETEGWAVKEIRTHVFRRPQPIGTATTPHPPRIRDRNMQEDSSMLQSEFIYTPTTPLLFLFSALTHNAHKVHYDKEWTISKEGHPAPLVHGPLTALLLVELAQAEAQRVGKVMERFEYRATSPIYVDREVKLSAWEQGEREDDGLVLKAEQEGRVGMTAMAHLYP